jgi:regulator of replication initiation timing
VARTDAERQASYRARQRELRRERIAVLEREIAKLRREVDDFSVKVAALAAENQLLRDDKIALTDALRASREAVRQEPTKQPRSAPRGKDPLEKYLWPASRK